MTTWFTADTHFGHAGARSLYRRPFASVPAMDQAIEDRWNQAVAPGDTVYHLGDFAVRHPDPASLLARLHGRKHLLTGNNDPLPIQALPAWVSVQPYLEIAADGHALVLCHYALRSWRDMGKGTLNLHGHSHGRLSRQSRQFDVGVDVWDFRPIRVADLLATRRRLGTAPHTG